jgi:hypothetical protein
MLVPADKVGVWEGNVVSNPQSHQQGAWSLVAATKENEGAPRTRQCVDDWATQQTRQLHSLADSKSASQGGFPQRPKTKDNSTIIIHPPTNTPSLLRYPSQQQPCTVAFPTSAFPFLWHRVWRSDELLLLSAFFEIHFLHLSRKAKNMSSGTHKFIPTGILSN